MQSTLRLLLTLVLLLGAESVLAQAYDSPIADAWLKEAAPNENHGDDKELPVKNKPGDNFRAVYQFDFSSIPVGANVTRADFWLRVTGEDDSGDPVNVYRITDNWSENTVNWNNTGNDYDASNVFASFTPDNEGWVRFDLIPLVQAWVCEEFENQGLMLIATSEDTESKYSSKEWNPGNRRPRLYLDYSATTGADCGGGAEFVINHDNFGINCVIETISVDVIDSAAGTPRNDYNAQVTLDTQTGRGTWSLVSGSGTFTDATADDGVATYDWPLGESTAEFALSYTNGTGSFDIDVYQVSDPSIRDDDSEGDIAFSPNGFSVTAAPLTNPPGAVAPFATSQVAGTDFPIYLAAYGQTPNDPECGIIESYSGAKSLRFWSGYIDPAAGSVAVSIDGTAIAATEAAAGAAAVTFVNGQAAVTGKYKDVGRIQIAVKDDSLAHPDLPNGIRGATADFVVRPFQFLLTDIQNGAGAPNPGAADANGALFTAAGEPFSVTVTAIDAEGSVTPNYGQELIPETVTLTSTLVAPAVGDNPALGNPTGFGAFVGGSATGANFTWPEVGIMQLTPSVGDGDYLGAGDVTGSASGNIGRFVPHHFTTVLNVPTFATQCAAGSFSYIGEVFDYSNAPVITLTARAAAGEITENYNGNFFKVDNASLPDPVYTSVPATLDTSGLPTGASDPAVADLGAGTGSLTFSSGTGLSYVRGAEEPPFDADIELRIDVIDGDGVTALGNPIQFGNPGGILFDSGATMRYGRARLLNAYGSELVNLALPLRTEYYADAGTGFVPNIDDVCTDAVTLSFGAFTDNLAAGETCAFDSGAPGSSGEGCAAPGPLALRFREPPLGGDFNLHLRAPGDGNDGSTTATADVPAWLEFDWDAASPGNEDPWGTAVFGIYEGQDRRIYTREVY